MYRPPYFRSHFFKFHSPTLSTIVGMRGKGEWCTGPFIECFVKVQKPKVSDDVLMYSWPDILFLGVLKRAS